MVLDMQRCARLGEDGVGGGGGGGVGVKKRPSQQRDRFWGGGKKL